METTVGDSNLRLELLGPPRVSVDGGPLEVDTRKALAVLALVAVDGEQSRESLARMLWPDSDPARAKAALRRTLSVLRRALDHRWLQAGRRRVTLDAPVDCDVTLTARLMDQVRDHDHADGPCEPCRSRLADLVAQYRGELLEGFVLRDSPDFDDWRAERNEYLRRRRCDALDQLARLHLAAEDLDASTEACRAWLEVDPLNERVYRRLMLLCAWRGERNEAIEHYRSCVTVLDRELGVTPMARTSDLYGAILEDRVPRHPAHDHDPAFRPSTTPPVPATSPNAEVVAVGQLPLVGRDDQLSRLLGDHLDGEAQLLVVAGEAGVGKTRLVEELASHLRERGTRVAMARCHPGEVELAFGSAVELLRQAVGQAPMSRLDDIAPWRLAEAARLVPDLVGGDRDLPPTASLSSPGAQARLFDAVWNVLELTVSIDCRGVLVLDDLHAIDDASLDLLGYGLRRLGDHDLTVVVCLRPEEVLDDDPVRRRLLDQPGIRDMAREVVLDRLTDQDVDRLVHAGLDRPDASAVARQITTESEGLPLLVVEYLRLVHDTNCPDADGDGGDVDLGQLVPHGAADLARRRLGQVSETARQVASTAATIGRSFDLSVVLQSSGRTEDEVVAGLEELVARQIVRELPHEPGARGGDVRYDFVHHKLREAIHDRTSLARRRLLHRRVADALAAGTRGGRDAGAVAALIADHHHRGGQDAQAAAWFRRAGDHARSLFANREALGHYRRALALDDADGERLQASVGEVCMLLGDYPAALDALELAAALAEGDASQAAVEHRLGTLHLRLGDLDAATAHFERAVTLADGDHARLARIHADQALLAVRADHLDHAETAAGTALAHGEEVDDVAATAQARNVLGLVARHRGHHAAARDHFVASAAMAADLGDADAGIAAMNNLALTEADMGDLDAAIERARDTVTLVARRGDRHREAALRNNLADLLHRAGREEESMAALKDAVAIFADVGQDPYELRPEIWKLVEW